MDHPIRCLAQSLFLEKTAEKPYQGLPHGVLFQLAVPHPYPLRLIAMARHNYVLRLGLLGLFDDSEARWPYLFILKVRTTGWWLKITLSLALGSSFRIPLENKLRVHGEIRGEMGGDGGIALN